MHRKSTTMAIWPMLLLLFGLVGASKLDAEMPVHLCPKHCTCDVAKFSMRCTHLRGGIPQPLANQQSFFSLLESDVNKTGGSLSMLIMHRAVFAYPTLSYDNFSHPIYADLVDLAFTATNLETIEARAFERLPKLSRLVFKYNQNLKWIEPEAFFGLNLQRLEFHESPMLQFQRDTIFVEARTNKLALTKCGLADFSYDVFHLLLKISLPMAQLDLEGNAIASVDSRFWPLFQNISQINLDNNALQCVEQNYWLYSLFRKNPKIFLTDQSDETSALSCTRPKTGELVLFRDAKPADFDVKPATTTIINNVQLPQNSEGHSNLFYEVQNDIQQTSALESNPAGRGAGSATSETVMGSSVGMTLKPDDYEEPIDSTIPGERVPSFGRNSGVSSIKRLMATPPWDVRFLTTLTSFARSSSTPAPPPLALENEEFQVDLSPPSDVGQSNTDAFFYILIIAGSVSFVSIIIGVITSVRRAATWPRQKGMLAVDKNAVVIVDKPLQPSNGGTALERLLSSVNNNNNNDTAAGMKLEDCIGESVGDAADTRCFENSNNNNATASNNQLYSVINRNKFSNNNNSHPDPDHLYAMDNFGVNNTNRYQHHSSNSTSPLLSASPQGSSHSSSNRSAVLLAPLPPPPQVSKVIRFADVESDDC